MNLSLFRAWLRIVPGMAAAVAGLSGAVVSPEVHPDHSVTFRLAAPGATKVQLSLESYPASELHRDAQGLWVVTTPPLEPDFYSYTFTVDGVATADPANPVTRPNLMWIGSWLHVPGPASLSWEAGEVPHGEIHHHFYHSEICGDDRDYYVYTPPGYDPARSELYPTLYLLHGFSDDASGWTLVGRANVILDNLIAQGKAKPMVVVMPLGYGDRSIVAKARAGGGNMRAGGWALMARNGKLFQEALLAEVMPQAEKEYRLSPDRLSRAIAGLSMGGGESLQTGLGHPDLFAWVGSFSAGGLSDDVRADFSAINPAGDAALKLLWIACGREDGLYSFNQRVREDLTSRGIRHVDITTPRAHVWQVWRRNLTDFAPLLFR